LLVFLGGELFDRAPRAAEDVGRVGDVERGGEQVEGGRDLAVVERPGDRRLAAERGRGGVDLGEQEALPGARAPARAPHSRLRGRGEGAAAGGRGLGCGGGRAGQCCWAVWNGTASTIGRAGRDRARSAAPRRPPWRRTRSCARAAPACSLAARARRAP